MEFLSLSSLKKHYRDNAGSLLRIDVNYHPIDAIIKNFNAKDKLEINYANKLVTPASIYLQFNCVSKKDDEEIKIAPYLLINQTNAEKLDETFSAVEHLGKGDGGRIRHFLCILEPNRKPFFGAPAFSFWHGEIKFDDSPDFYKLKKGEIEVFELHVMQYPGYKYNFKVAVLLEYKGKKYTKWLPISYEVAMLEGEVPVYEYGLEKYWKYVRTTTRKMLFYDSPDYVIHTLIKADEQVLNRHRFEASEFDKQYSATA